ncbi:MAG: toxin-antitoxin system YwqK family antitoxin [Winogradskyella sp.]|uniref:toxin-antitoxin system YwqK family antitoxin n=1 Tax=Winogradskyella sp. TaxID=1883156 RepID=UPI00185309F6|nr:toxin-antitoxin system YwqK family antitoxin [Winogradskyella sp.]MBT8245077.1 toxin-antitoxin system YwqK family antitoxin [Winogradskyella sp.]NNK22441.1 toxin-antitoxin system YwqK family antitoxin [Winogradskyella sp.]
MIRRKIILGIIFTIILTSLPAQNQVNKFDKSGKRHGVWHKNYPNTNQLRYEGKFNHGKEIDTFKYYKLKRKKSVLSAIKVFNPENDISEVTFTASNGKIVSKGKMDGKNFIDDWVFYHKNSNNVMIEEHYNSKGNLDGKRVVYFIDGKIAEEIDYRNGVQDGQYKIYSESGKLLQNSSYSVDKLNGNTSYYDIEGNVRAKGNFVNNLKTGIWEYYKNGELVRKVDHNANKILYKKQ